MSANAPPLGDPERLDLRAVCERLRAGKATAGFMDGWLPATYQAPEGFVRALHAHASRRPGGLKSRLGEGYDFYHDCVLAHVDQRRRAVVEAGAGSETSISFEGLHQRCAALAAAWRASGVEPGQSIAVVLPVGIDHVAAVLAALCVGAVVSTVPPAGPTFVRNRLAMLAPDHVVTAERHRRALGEHGAALLSLSAPRAAEAEPSHWYAPDELAARLFSPFAEELAPPFELTASALHESILRDGLLVLGLSTSDTLAAPGFDPLQHQPSFLLSALAAGAAYAAIAMDDLEEDPAALGRLGVTVLGIHKRLREVLLRRGVEPLGRACRAWFRSLTEVFDVERWGALGRAIDAHKIPGFVLATCAALGGAHLFGPPTGYAPIPRVWPVPGRSWQLSELTGNEVPALNGVGTYTPLRDGAPEGGFPRIVLSRQPEGYLFTGVMERGRDAQTYPASEVARAVERHPAVRHAAAVIAPGRWMNDAKVVLLAFVGHERDEGGRLSASVLAKELAALCVREMGEQAAPDRIEIFPLRPRLADGVADAAWCRSQYLSGALHAKSRSEIFLLLSRLGYILAGAPPPG